MDPEDALHSLMAEREKLTMELLKARREHTRLLTNIAQFREQLEVYDEHLKSLRAAKICSLREWKETETFIYHTANQLTNDREKLVNVEQYIKENDKNLDRIKVQTTQAQDDLDAMGRIIRFPFNDDRRSSTAD